MSYWGHWKCPKCEKEWDGGIGWNWPNTPEEMAEHLETICGCTKKKFSKEKLSKIKVVTTFKREK